MTMILKRAFFLRFRDELMPFQRDEKMEKKQKTPG